MDATVKKLTEEFARPLTGAREDYDPLLEMIGDARFALLGEASHGTHEFYRERAQITKRLITEKGFRAVAVEADWPDAYRVNRYVRGAGADASANDALGDFKRFPTWMWRNTDVLDFVEWLRDHNDALSDQARKIGFYGLDLYSLFTSIEAVLAYLDKVDPEAARRARYRYSCFEDFGEASLLSDNGATNYVRVDWFTPAGLSTWGDGRLMILGEKGTIELRKYVDVARDKTGNHVYLVDAKGEQHFEVEGKVGFRYFGELILDCIHRTEKAMTQAHAFKAAELCLKAQAAARRIG